MVRGGSRTKIEEEDLKGGGKRLEGAVWGTRALSAQTWTRLWAGIGTWRQESNTLGCL